MSAAKSSSGRLWAVIMAGGSGTRFWPLSRAKTPKQFLKLVGRKTLLEQTVSRFRPLVPSSRLLVVTQKENVPKVRRLLRIPDSQIVGEPAGRNTAPCAALAAARILEKDPDAILALVPSDHHIGKPAVFRSALQLAARVAAKEGSPVTFGIKPEFAHTGYGYLELEKRYSKQAFNSVFRLKSFHEKPSLQKARRFLESKRFLWNSGMFVWRADRLLAAVKKFLPQVYQLTQRITKGSFETSMKRYYTSMPNVSIDYGLMEELSGKVFAIPVEMDWHDLGACHALERFWPKDAHGNAVQGQAIFVESRGNIVKSPNGKLAALLGVEDLIIVDTPDAFLVCPKQKTESIRSLVRQLKGKLEKYL